MSKQLNVKLNFQADTSQVQQALNSLQSSLSTIANMTPMSGNKLSQDLAIAKQSAQELQMHLNNAFNMKTGNLDLGRLDASLKSSGQNLGQLSANLLKAGTSGEQAFLNIQRAVGNASVQINQANGMLSQFMTTLKNTARWQISSSILHGFVSAVQSAWGYAKDLDKSLNSIRIVTGYSSDKMADFAIEANKAAKALSTTTTKYTDASLIFYQQGLSDSEVQKRTDITIKMANAAGQSAEIVSDQLTAVWNNFYDGSKSLEYYADVMTALGAATASSTDEIAGGLEKFAAIGETIGLSYEYAAAALATITSNTRQSEEVVGTALKTIFARIQGLKLGETLEDGTSLNKYSEALSKVGISIFEQNGELKKMDNILDEMGAKWDTLSSAQQAALAQTVAGTRQYTQLIALMKDWDTGDSDSMMANLETAYNSEGALQEQADIYADSWEAASDRVQAAAEGIYRDLFPTEELTGLMDGVTIILEGIDGLVQAFGGLQGILLLVSSIMLQTFQVQIGSSIDNVIMKVQGGLSSAFQSVSNTVHGVSDGTLKWYQALGQIFGGYQNVVTSTQQIRANLQDVYENSQNVEQQSKITAQNMEKGVSATLAMSMEMTQAANSSEHLNANFQQYNTNMMQINNVQALIEQSARHLTKEQQSQLALLQEQAQAANEQMLTAQNTLDIEQQRKDAILAREGDQLSDIDRFDTRGKDQTLFTSDILHVGQNQKNAESTFGLYGSSSNLGEDWAQANIQLEAVKGHLAVVYSNSVDLVQVNKDANNTYATMAEANAKVANLQKALPKNSTQYCEELEKISQELQSQEGFAGAVARKHLATAKSAEEIEKGIAGATSEVKTFSMLTGSSSKQMAEIDNQVRTTYNAFNNLSSSAENFKNKMSQVVTTLQNGLSSAMSVGNVMSSMASGFSSIAMGISSISNALETFSDEDANFTTKLTAGAMAATMGIRGLGAAIGFLNTFVSSINTAMALNEAATLAMTAATDKDSAAQLVNVLVKKLKLSQEEAEAKVTLITSGAIKVETAETAKNTVANWANVASQAAKFWYISLIIAGIAALVAVTYLLVTAEDAETAALKRSQEALQQSKENYDSAKESVESFKSSLSDYNEGLKGLEDIKGKSDELRKAVEELNAKALELIETYGLFGKFSYGKFGEIIIDQDALGDVEAQLLENEKRAQNVMYTNQIQVNQAQDKINANKVAQEKVNDWTPYTVAYKYTKKWLGGSPTETSREYLDNPSEQKAYVGETYRNSQGSEEYTGVAVEERQLAADELKGLGKAVQDVQEQFGKVEVDQLIKTIQEADNSYGLSESAIKDLTGIINDETLPSLLELGKEMYGAAEASRHYAQQVMRNEIESKYGEKYKQLATDQDGNVNEQLYANILDASAKYASTNTTVDGKTLEEHLSGIDVSGATTNSSLKNYKDKEGNNYNISDDRILGRTYATEVKGWNEKDVSYSAGTGEGTLTNLKTGEEITIEDSVMREGLAKESSVKATTDEFNKALDESMANFNTAMASVVENAASDEIANTVLKAAQTEGGAFDYENLVHQLSPEDLINLNEGGMTSEEIFTKLGLNESDLAAMGVQTGEEFLKGFKGAMENYDASKFYANMATQAREQATSSANSEGFGEEESADMGEYATHLMQVAKESDLLADSLETDAETAAELAVQVGKMNRGIETLADNFGDWKDVLNNSSKESIEYSKAMQGTQKALADVLDVEEQFVSDSFVKDHLEDIEKAATGDADAIDNLRKALGESIILDVTGAEDINSLKDNVKTALTEMENAIDNADLDVGSKIEVNADGIDSTGFIDACNGIVDAAGMSVDQAQAYFNSLGYEPEFVMENKTEKAPMYGKKVFTEDPVIAYADTGDGSKYPYIKEMTTREEQVYMGEHEQNFVVPALSNDGTPKIRSITKKATGSMNNFSSSNKGGGSPGKGGGGGGGSKPKKTSESKKKKSEIVDRYKEINDQIEKTTRQMNKTTIAADGLWGSKRIAMLKKNIDLMKQECKQLEEKHKLSIKYLNEDRNALEQAASEAGISFSFDDNGTITNYTSKMTALFNKREALLKSFGDTMDEDEEERLKELDDKIEAVKSAYEQYETTLDERDDFEEERLQKVLDTQTAYYDMLNEELEIKISIDEDALETIEYYLSKIEDDFYQMFEAAALMIGDASSLEQGQIKHYLSEIDSQQKYVEDLEKAHTTIDPKTGETEINDAQYMEGLRQAKTDTIASLQALQDLDKTMMHYYGDTLAAASEELSKYTTLMEHQTSVLDHYKNIMDILGQGKDYKKMGVILDAQAKTIGNEAKVAKENYNMLKEQAEARKAEYQAALDSDKYSEAEREAYRQRWMDAENAANEAQENMLSKTEAWAEAMKAVVENKLNDLDQTLENALTADFGGSFDLMNSAFERANSLQEEFLTTTNKIYETNKLMRQAQQEIDKISNEVAKKRLKQFINETNQLQNKNKLSNYELEIQQAKYDLALAQIALEEAQNAKSTVRLQRDAEGNFGYVYTADQNAVAEAQQKFEDAQNSLYNIGLEGANSYAEKYQQTLSEFYSTMTELQHQYLNGEFENEAEYQEAMLAAREYYYEKLQQYSSLYTVAISTDTRVVADAWSTQYANMTQNTEEWMFNVDSYVEGVKVAFGEWETQMAQIEEETIGPDLDALTERTKTLTNKSQELADTILGENGVLNAIEQEVTQVAELTGAYAGLREEIQEAIRQREELIRQIDERIQNENEGEDGDGSRSGGDGDGSGGGNGNLDPKDASTKRGVALAIWNGSYGWGTGKTRKDRLKEKGFNPDEIQDLVNNTDPSAGWGSRYGITDLSKYAYSKFDTGGYTGAWGANGKFAMLHEKELVLNKGDTENFLASMELLDTIIKTIDLHSTNAALGGLLNSPYLNGMNNNEVLEQNVTIEANFPNVSSRTEIEEAFTTLVNRASQYANRK